MIDPEVLDKIKRACSPQKAIYDIANYMQTDIVPPINEATNTANAAAAQANAAYNRATDALNTANGVAADVARSLVDLTAGGDGSTVTLNAPRNTGNPATAPLPVADSTKAGVMNSATYVNLQNLNTRVSSLENQTTTYIVSFTNDNPTQDEINNAYKTAYPTAPFPPIDGTTVIDQTRQLYYRWVKNGAIWLKTTGFVISQFTNETAGTIKGSTTAGQIQAETDGTGSLVGYDQIKNDIAANATGITTLTDNLAATNSDIATLRTTVNSNTSKANLAINTINSSADASNAKVGYVRNNGTQETINLPIVSATQAGVVTPTMFNAWNAGYNPLSNHLTDTGDVFAAKQYDVNIGDNRYMRVTINANNTIYGISITNPGEDFIFVGGQTRRVLGTQSIFTFGANPGQNNSKFAIIDVVSTTNKYSHIIINLYVNNYTSGVSYTINIFSTNNIAIVSNEPSA